MKRLIFLLMIAAAVVPAWAIAAGPDATKNANADCTALRATLGASFSNTYATFGACVSAYAPIEQGNNTSANTSCTALQSDASFAASHTGKTFAQFYGTGKNGNNAFGNCVSTLAKTSSQTEQQGRLNASQTCRALKAKLGAAPFASYYGKNASDKNAFGKCVSNQAHSQSQNELSASASCQAAQTADAQAFLHYGTNADKSNAFGKCVSTTAADKSTAQQQATVSAAKACAAEKKAAGLSAFTVKYGTFRNCVSQKASSK